MKQSQLVSVVLKQLKDIAKRKEINKAISDETIIGDIVSSTDGKGSSNSKNVFRIAIGWTLAQVKIKKAWPSGWDGLSVKEFASKFFLFFLLIGSLSTQAQLQVTLGTSKTTLREGAISIGISYIKNLDSVFGHQDYLIVGKRSGLLITPEANIVTGNQDAFSSITVKATGLLMAFKTQVVDDITTPDLLRGFHTFPMSIGIETNNLFNAINGIIEAGWVPWFNANTELGRKLNLGVYLQAGYKFYGDSTGKNAIGGQVDESKEEVRSTILRTKGSLGIDTKSLLKMNGLDVGLVGTADVWYDFLNGATYHKIDARGRFYITQDNFIDLIYQKGAGAPTFNGGDQYGLGLTVTF